MWDGGEWGYGSGLRNGIHNMILAMRANMRMRTVMMMMIFNDDDDVDDDVAVDVDDEDARQGERMMRGKKTRTEGKRTARRVSCEERGPNWLGGGQMSRRPNVNLHPGALPPPPLLYLPLAEPSGPRDGRAIQPEVAKRDQHTALYSVRRRRRRRRRRGIQCHSRPSYRARFSFSGKQAETKTS